MDLHFTNAQPTATERNAVDQLLGMPATAWEGSEQRSAGEQHVAHANAAPSDRRALLLPALHAVSDNVGWISEGALNYICKRLDVPPADAYGVVSFYALFSTTPRPPRVLHVCDDIACLANGAAEVCAALEGTLGPAGTGANACWLRSPCLGLCERAPAALLLEAGEPHREEAIAPVTAAAGSAALQAPAGTADKNRAAGDKAAALPQAGSDRLRLLRRAGRVDPTSLEAYKSSGGYQALQRALDIGPNGIIAEVTASKLVGRGGAAFPTGRKWQAVAAETARPHYVVCNADESEPGTFKDRVLMEHDPFAVIESMTIAAFAGGCEHVYLYIRGEYPAALQRLDSAIKQARSQGLLGKNILRSDFAFDIELRRGAGAYICGEETALFNSIEGFRGEPRNKPPFPVQKGLFGKPTIVNNVETLANVLDIVLLGGAAFARTGTSESTGTKLFCVSGNVARPGLYEVPFGTTLRELLAQSGGMNGGGALQAVLLGGAAGVFVTPDEIDTPLTLEGVRAIKATIGSGVVIAFDQSIDLLQILRRIALFFRDESCGQCVPCRVGTARQEELLKRLGDHRPLGSNSQERALLAQIGQVMRDASICGLGQTASSALESAVAKFGLFQ
ncbi:MAG: NAD(P)H-dependent oxidoreductase subunit E [Candidatus Eremiobacteraeota bacterium]|nr:NAD(P)H-dependent oxidoreductase subunit E [Candidatus Eremiobacteraeota bacterium]